jgi:chromate reductase, NAD(P)H dehydrogenase (quinone)
MTRVLALSGSLRAGSHSTSLLRHAAARAGDELELILYDGLRDIPPFDEDSEDDEALTAPVERLKRALKDADGVLIATPEYNGSVSGVLKNALDWVSRPFDSNPLRGKPVAVISASTGSFGGVWAQNDLRRILGTIGARVLDESVAVPNVHTVVDGVGEIAHPGTSDGLAELLQALQAELVDERLKATA